MTAPAGLNGMNGIPSQRPYEADFQRAVPPRPVARAAPAARRPLAPAVRGARRPRKPSRPSAAASGPGTGISAAYRAVSLAGDPAAPLAERIPMTEEIPVVSESGPRPGLWPTPSPPPPAQAVPARAPEPPAPPAYEPPAYEPPPAYDPARHAYDTRLLDPDVRTVVRHPDPPTYAAPSYDTPSAYDPLVPRTKNLPPRTPPATAAAYDETAPMPGPLFPPPAGEPWHAPAGDRP